MITEKRVHIVLAILILFYCFAWAKKPNGQNAPAQETEEIDQKIEGLIENFFEDLPEDEPRQDAREEVFEKYVAEPVTPPRKETPAERPAQKSAAKKLPAQPPALPRREPKEYTIHKVWLWQESRDCLWVLADKYYGDPWMWKEIYLANRDKIKDPRVIFPRQELKIPKLKE